MKTEAGFTLIELIVVLVLIGLLAALAVPSWLSFWDTMRLNVAQDILYQALLKTQSQAKIHRSTWQLSMQQSDRGLQWAIHPASEDPDSAAWTLLDPNLDLVDAETTLRLANHRYKVEFTHEGRVNGQLGRLTLHPKGRAQPMRCTIVSTLLGAIRKGQNQSRKQNGFWCY